LNGEEEEMDDVVGNGGRWMNEWMSEWKWVIMAYKNIQLPTLATGLAEQNRVKYFQLKKTQCSNIN
jgi:hypothetical protein